MSKRSKQSSHRLPESACPACGCKLDAATRMHGDRPPEPGSVTVCIACTEVLVLADDLTLRQSDPMELLRMQLSPVWDVIERVRAAIRITLGASR